MTQDSPQEEAWNSTPEKLKRWYDLYLAYEAESKKSRLEVTLNPEGREMIEAEQLMSKERFEKAVDSMKPGARVDYLHRLEIGYRANLLAIRGNKLYKDLRKLLPGEDTGIGDTGRS